MYNIKAVAKQMILEKIEMVMKQAKSLYPEMEGFQYKFGTTIGRSAGRAGYKSRMGVVNGVFSPIRSYFIKINIDLMVSCEKAWEHIYEETIPHEVAHLVDYVRRDKSGHDKVWRDIAISLGCKGETHHDLNVVVSGKPMHQYVMDCGTKIKVSHKNHQYIQADYYRGGISYRGESVEKHHYDKPLTLDILTEVPEKYKHLDTGNAGSVKDPKEYLAPSGMYVKYKPTKQAIDLWNTYGDDETMFICHYKKGSYEAVMAQLRHCRKWFKGKGL